MQSQSKTLQRIVVLKLVALVILVAISWNAQAADGKAVYDRNCKICHESGGGGAPALTNKEEWKKRLEKGIDGLVDIAINGVQGYGGDMPPKGGNPALTDEEVKAAVVYMVDRVK